MTFGAEEKEVIKPVFTENYEAMILNGAAGSLNNCRTGNHLLIPLRVGNGGSLALELKYGVDLNTNKYHEIDSDHTNLPWYGLQHLNEQYGSLSQEPRRVIALAVPNHMLRQWQTFVENYAKKQLHEVRREIILSGLPAGLDMKWLLKPSETLTADAIAKLEERNVVVGKWREFIDELSSSVEDGPETRNLLRTAYQELFQNAWGKVRDRQRMPEILINWYNPKIDPKNLPNLQPFVDIAVSGLTQQMAEHDKKLAKFLAEEAGANTLYGIHQRVGTYTDHILATKADQTLSSQDVQPLDLQDIEAQIAAQFDANLANSGK